MCLCKPGREPETAGGQPGAAGPMLLPGRRSAEGEAGVTGVAAPRPLQRRSDEEGGGHIPAEAEGARAAAGGGYP